MISLKRLIFIFTTILFLIPLASSADSAQYVGVKKCKMCHNKKSETQQYTIWENSAHAKAYETLATEAALKMAADAGVKGNPQEAKECLECHVTGFGEDSTMFKESFNKEKGVQCESCHGPGSEYKSVKIMSKKKYAAQREVQSKLAAEAGLIKPDEKSCIKCHNKCSPAFKGFDYKTYYEKIKHEYKR